MSEKKPDEKSSEVDDHSKIQSSDEEEDKAFEEMLKSPVFSKKKNTQSKTTVADTKTDVPTVTQEDEDEGDNKEKTPQASSTKNILLPDDLERQARQRVESMSLHLIQKVKSISDLAWHKFKKGKTSSSSNYVMMPCRRNCHPDEAIGLPLADLTADNKELVQYLGYQCKDAGLYYMVPTTQLVEFGKTDKVAMSSSPPKNDTQQHTSSLTDEDEQHLVDFIKYFESNQKKKSKQEEQQPQQTCQKTPQKPHDEKLESLVEEYTLRAMFDKVRQKQVELEKTSNGKKNDSCPSSNDSNKQEDDHKSNSLAESSSSSGDHERQKQENVVPCNKNTSKAERVESQNDATSSKNDNPSNSASSSDDDDDELEKEARKKESLRDGDVIVYNPPQSVVGLKGNLIQATILGIDAKHSKFPLILNTGDLLHKSDVMVKLIKKRMRGKLHDNSKQGTFKAIESYKLSTCGTKNRSAGRQQQARELAEVLNRNNEELGNFARTFSVPSASKSPSAHKTRKTPTRKSAAARKVSVPATAPPATRRRAAKVEDGESRSGKKRRAKDTEDDSSLHRKKRRATLSAPQELVKMDADIDKTKNVEDHLIMLLDQVKSNMKTKRRYQPHFTVKQLEVAIAIWKQLTKIKDHSSQTTTMEALVRMLAGDLAIPLYRLENYLRGDDQNRLRKAGIEQLEQILSAWLDEQYKNGTCSFDSQPLVTQLDNKFSACEKTKNYASPRKSPSSSLTKQRPATKVECLEMSPLRESVMTPLRESAIRSSIVPATAPPVMRRAVSTDKTAKRVRWVKEPPASVTKSRKRRASVALKEKNTIETIDLPDKRQRRMSCSSTMTTESTTIAQFDWMDELSSLIELVKHKIKTKSGRYHPHMTVEELELAMAVWPRLEEQLELNDDGTPISSSAKALNQIASIVTKLAIELGVTHYGLVRFLRGDSSKRLSRSKIEQIFHALSKWLNERTNRTSLVENLEGSKITA